MLKWPADPERADAGPACQGRRGRRRPRAASDRWSILVNGALGAYISRGARQLQVFLPEDEPARSTVARARVGAARGARESGGTADRRRSTASRPPSIRSRRSWSTPGLPVGDGLHDAAGAAAIPSFNLDLDEAGDPADEDAADIASGMPEGDTIFRAARTLHRALAGKAVVHFESVFPALTRVHDDAPLTGRTIEQRLRRRASTC